MKPYKIAFQLYSARRFPPLERQLEQLAAIGYDAVEPWLPAYGDDPQAFRRQIDAAGLACLGFHMPLSGLLEETDRFIDIAQAIGAPLMIPPWVPPEERGADAGGWRRLGESLAWAAEKVRPAGLSVAWHNHDFEYVPLADGSRPIDHLLGSAGRSVGFEIDCGWITRAGADPAAELSRYAARIVAIQAKDMAPPGTTVEDGWAATGDGIIDWKALWPLFRGTAADHIVVEHDNPADWLSFAKRSFDALKLLASQETMGA
jgi:sugar phosphate isomerase/epimerase